MTLGGHLNMALGKSLSKALGGSLNMAPVSYTHLTLPTNAEV